MKKHQIKLIDNTYPAEQARTVLLTLIEDKIKFLNQQIFSISERFGLDTSHLENRVKELQVERNNLLDFLEEYGDPDNRVQVNCDVNIAIHQNEMA